MVVSGHTAVAQDGLAAEPSPVPPGHEEMQASLRVLQWLAEHPGEGPSLPELGQAVARAYKRVRKQRRIQAAQARKVNQEPRTTLACYICGGLYEPHDDPYPRLCPACGLLNQAHRTRRGDLRGRRAVVTGGRVKVGYQIVLKLLRDGAQVVATTRFPADAARRYAAEPDFAQWQDRLVLYGLDLRDLRALQRFVGYVQATGAHLDLLINNAAQTIRRPPAFYTALQAQEAALQRTLPEGAQRLLASAEAVASHTAASLSAMPRPSEASLVGVATEPFASSWLLPLEEIAPVELAEVMVINTMAPFLLCRHFEPLLRSSPFPDRYVVNVTSAEGQFARASKAPEHPHTNMAKAALNMLTRTAAERCAASGIYMNSVDPGWITHMTAVDPAQPEEAPVAAAEGFVPPLDAVDGAARIYDPILRGLAGSPVFGLLLRDYQPAPW